MRRDGWTRVAALVLTVLLLCGCRSGGPAGNTGTGGKLPIVEPLPTSSASRPVEDAWSDVVYLDGVQYRQRKGLRTVLFLGVDKTATNYVAEHIPMNNGRADSLMLFILDEANQTAQTLAISRDTMIGVDVYLANGDYAYTDPMNLNMQYSYGNSDTRSCFLTVRKVSELLYGVHVDDYIALQVEGMKFIVDAIGGVNLTLPEDLPELGPEYVQGTQLTLDGEKAEWFVRERDTNVSGSNNPRMNRQELFLQSLFRQMKSYGNTQEKLSELLDAAGDYITTNMSADTMKALATYELSPESFKVPGETILGEVYDEYIVDEQALQELVLQLFYEPIS